MCHIARFASFTYRHHPLRTSRAKARHQFDFIAVDAGAADILLFPCDSNHGRQI